MIEGKQWGDEDDFWPPIQGSQHDYELKQQQHIRQILKNLIQLPQYQQVKIERMAGYVTKNFKVSYEEGGCQKAYVLKIYKFIGCLDVHAEFISSALGELNKLSDLISIHTPFALDAQGRFVLVKYDEFWETKVMIRLLSFVEGGSWLHYITNLRQKDPKSWFTCQKYKGALISSAKMVASIDLKLDEIQSQIKQQSVRQVLHKNEKWIIECSNKWGCDLNEQVIPCAQQRAIFQYSRYLFDSYIQKNGHKLKKSLIHNDVNADNLRIISQRQNNQFVMSLIDFDDCLVCYRIGEVAISITHLLAHSVQDLFAEGHDAEQQDVHIALVCEFCRAYDQILKFDDSQIGALYYFVCARLTLLCVNMTKDREQIESPLEIEKVKIYSFYLINLLAISPKVYTQRLCKALQRDYIYEPNWNSYAQICERLGIKREGLSRSWQWAQLGLKNGFQGLTDIGISEEEALQKMRGSNKQQ